MSDGSRANDPRRRFDGRVEEYHLYRPGYPTAILDWLARACGLAPGWHVADLGSGTGKLAALFLDLGCRVHGIEPNGEMRRKAERELGDRPRFTSVAGAAEATGLPSHSVDLVVAGQAFHWFDLELARTEIRRILRAAGPLAVIWNERRVDASPFSRAWEALLSEHAIDYHEVDHSRFDRAAMDAFFDPSPVASATFPNRQILDFDSITGRLLSCSYAPPPGHPGHAAMLADLATIFDEHNEAGEVALEYDCRVYLGRLG